MTLLFACLILSQAVYWLFFKDETERLAEETWRACVDPGGTK